ncbi:MAG: NAD(P)H-dependent glycerol-3-phosphate dehydrogenase [Desulfovibrionaceae bacterium]
MSNQKSSFRRVTVLGAGAWGTTLADMLARNNVGTCLWVREADLAERMRTSRVNDIFLPDLKLCPALEIESDPATALNGADVYLVVVPSQFIRPTLHGFRDLFPQHPVIVCASKGIELDSLAPMSRVVAETLENKAPRYASLSGPSFAAEVSRDMPTSVSLGCADLDLARELRELFSTPFFRVYSTPDFRGVELGGAVKNVIALAAGMSDGLGFGHDARAALITRGLAEMSRLGEAMGAQERTFMGLSGMGDLVLTCTGDLSRNRQVGLKIGQGRKLDDIIGEMKAVAEGVKTAQSLHNLARKLEVELPITEQVYRILYENVDPRKAVGELMSRSLKDE